jgi:hypothetical protein
MKNPDAPVHAPPSGLLYPRSSPGNNKENRGGREEKRRGRAEEELGRGKGRERRGADGLNSSV